MQKNLPLCSSKLSSSLLGLLLILLPSCGRKPKHLFSRKEVHSKINAHRLTLPAVQDVSAAPSDEYVLVSWHALPQPITELARPHERVTLGPEPLLQGYNVYRFATDGFVPKAPLNSEPITTTTCLDTKDRGNHKWHYLVRGVYLVHGRTVQGPMSQVA